MSISDYVNDLNNSSSSISYLDSSLRRQVQLPLALSWYTGSGTTDPNNLYTDDPSLYFVYSGGWHQTAISSQNRDRYNGITITLLEGGPVYAYVQAADNVFRVGQKFYGAPYTTSGEAGSEELILSTFYTDTPENPNTLAMELPSPGTYKIVFPSATDSEAFVVSHSGVGSYRVSQIIPRRAVQAYDIDVNSIKAYHVTASLIDTISLRVSDSIVVGPELIGAKSIDGSKIVDGTLSGVLIANGTVTGNKVLAGTISGVLITASSITGGNIAANTITADKVTTSFVDTIALQVSNSIVVGPELIGVKSIDGSKIVDGTLSGVLIANGTVTGNKVLAGTISGVLITAGTITGDRIAATTISGSLLTAGTITFDKIASNTLTSGQIADGTITGQKIVSGTISGVLITDNAITASKISANTITGDKIVANTISGALITAGTITADNIATRTITADRIVLSGIVANLLGPEAVTAAALASGAVISGKLAANSVTANNVTAGIIQGYHVAADTITGANIFAATISGSLMTAGTITFDKIASNTLTSGQIANGTITGQNILAGTVSGVLITDGTIAASKITANTITASQIAAGTITATQLAANTITASKIAAGTITTTEIAANTITASDIAAGTITATEIAANTITANKLSVNQLDAVAANMGTLTVNSGITIGTDGYLWAGAGSAATPTTGLKIYTSDGISRLTTFSGGIAQVDIASDGRLYAGSGQSLKLDFAGVTFKTAVSGVVVSNARTGIVTTLTTAYPPKNNLIKFHPYYVETTAGTSVFYEDASDSVLAFFESTQLYKTNGSSTSNSYKGAKTRIRSGWLPSESGLTTAWTGVNDSVLDLESNASTYAGLNLSTGTETSRASITLSGQQFGDYSYIDVNAKFITINPTKTDFNNPTFKVTNPATIVTFEGATTVNNTLTAGNTTISGTLNVASDFKVNTDKFTVAPATGNTVVAGTLSVTGAASASNLSGSTSGTNTGDQIMPIYGDGADGAVTFNGSSTYNFATYASAVYTLTRDVWATTVNVSSGYTVITAGYRIFATTSIYAAGNIHNNGSAGSGITAGAGGLAGFFKEGRAGAAGLGTAIGGSDGSVNPTPTANTWVGGLGGRGGQGYSNRVSYNGGLILSTNLTTPANADGGSKVTSNIVNYLNRYVVGATNWQMTPSVGGGSGAKSALGTSATSGAGGGGGGIVFLAAPTITCSAATISADGGAGGNAAGTGGNFGGGGGGGGGIVAYVCKTDSGTYTANGGAGGTSVIGTNGTLSTAVSNGTATTIDASNVLAITPTRPIVKGSLYILAFHLNSTGGTTSTGVNSITGGGISWNNASTRVTFSTIATPVRVLEVWWGIKTNATSASEPDFVDDATIKVYLNEATTTQRVILDEIQGINENQPIAGNNATNVTNSAATLTVTLPSSPTANSLVYSVFARSGGTAITAGTGNTALNIQSNGPQLTSQVSSAQQANAQSHTTASAIAGVSLEITKSTAGQNGSYGWNGKVIRLYG